MASLSSVGFFNKGETRADLKCVGKHPSESDKLTIDTIGVTNISIQSFTKPVGHGSKSDYLHGADRTRRKRFPKNSIPCIDGLTWEFYLKFWENFRSLFAQTVQEIWKADHYNIITEGRKNK